MPSVEYKTTGGSTTIYFDREVDRHKYEDFTANAPKVASIFEKRIGKANVLEGDKQAVRVYQSMYDRKEWKGEFTPNQIRKIYKEAI